MLLNISSKSHRFTFKGLNMSSKNKSLFCSRDSNGVPNKKADVICDTDIVVHLSANMRAAEESNFILTATRSYLFQDL